MGYLPYFHWLAGFSSINSMSKTFPFSISYVNSLCHGHRCLFQLLQHLVPQMLWILGAKKGSKTKKTGWLKSLTKNKEKCMWTDLQEIYSEVRLFVRTLKKIQFLAKFLHTSQRWFNSWRDTHPQKKKRWPSWIQAKFWLDIRKTHIGIKSPALSYIYLMNKKYALW